MRHWKFREKFRDFQLKVLHTSNALFFFIMITYETGHGTGHSGYPAVKRLTSHQRRPRFVLANKKPVLHYRAQTFTWHARYFQILLQPTLNFQPLPPNFVRYCISACILQPLIIMWAAVIRTASLRSSNNGDPYDCFRAFDRSIPWNCAPDRLFAL